MEDADVNEDADDASVASDVIPPSVRAMRTDIDDMRARYTQKTRRRTALAAGELLTSPKAAAAAAAAAIATKPKPIPVTFKVETEETQTVTAPSASASASTSASASLDDEQQSKRYENATPLFDSPIPNINDDITHKPGMGTCSPSYILQILLRSCFVCVCVCVWFV
jgi:hypothetical protein